MVVTLGQQYNIGEKPTVVLYTYINRHAGTPKKQRRQNSTTSNMVVITYCYIEQPIMQIEDRLFDRGWVRSAMATRKCGNIYFPKYFMAVRSFFTRIFFQELFGLEG